jgi:hypothetical protein
MHRRLAVDAPIGIAAAVDADVDPGFFERPIADSLPLLTDRFNLARPRPETVELASLGAKAARPVVALCRRVDLSSARSAAFHSSVRSLVHDGASPGAMISLCRTPYLRVKSHTTPSRSSTMFSAAR